MRAGRLRHDGNPVLDWCLSNVVGRTDRRGNLYPTKQRPDQKVDAADVIWLIRGGDRNILFDSGCHRDTFLKESPLKDYLRPDLAVEAAGVKPEDVMATLERLADFKAKGILTQEEFDAKKAELLKKLA